MCVGGFSRTFAIYEYHSGGLFSGLCSDGRIKVIGGYNIEALLISPKQMPYKNLEVC